MTDHETLTYIRGVIASLPQADQRGVQQAAQALRELLARTNDHGRLALALVGAEQAMEGHA
ncbi:hypothetical protein EBQ34_00595 [Vandammella animalimorsus]|uniref:Uncharacterized protein n=1 Tax=Vandammella animalimorsus TaxID=2029117 RepID=A0A3M6RVM2_9BURK|nr:hypothetical protein [Vandammella animalimorsus]RMX18895.1 hypothetical protein EBQ34_00595 [Vandammella animalimorsus]